MTSSMWSSPTSRPSRSRSTVARRRLLPALTAANCSRNSGSAANASRPRSRSRSTVQPAPSASVMSSASVGVGEPDEAARRDAVGDVRELAGEELVEVGQHLVAQQLGVQLRDAVDLRAGDGREVGHPHRAVRVLADDRHGADAQLVVAEALAHREEELVVDAVDDLEVARKQPSEQVDRPHFERLGKKRVARVREALLRDRPRGIPLHLALVDQHAHELGHGDDRVRVVELEDHAVGQLREVEAVGEHVVRGSRRSTRRRRSTAAAGAALCPAGSSPRGRAPSRCSRRRSGRGRPLRSRRS